MSKFKVGDKVRVTGDNFDDNIGFHLLPKGHEGVIIDIDKSRMGSIDVAELDNSKSYVIALDDLELITPLTFDHSLALQGSPVYMDGKQIQPMYDPQNELWISMGDYFYKDGKGRYNTLPLTTIPPEVYVEERRWVWVHPNNVVHMYEDHHDKKMWEHRGYQLCEVKIKVKK